MDESTRSLVAALRTLHTMLNTRLPNELHQQYIVEVLASAGVTLDDGEDAATRPQPAAKGGGGNP